MALSSRLADENLMVLKGITLPEVKTKHFAKVMQDLGLTRALIVLPEDNADLDRSSRNIPGVKLLTVDQLNVLDVLAHKQLVLLEGSVAPVTQRFTGKEA